MELVDGKMHLLHRFGYTARTQPFSHQFFVALRTGGDNEMISIPTMRAVQVISTMKNNNRINKCVDSAG